MSRGGYMTGSPGSQYLVVHALDGFPLAVRHFRLPHSAARLVVAGATGVPQGFYWNFAGVGAAIRTTGSRTRRWLWRRSRCSLG